MNAYLQAGHRRSAERTEAAGVPGLGESIVGDPLASGAPDEAGGCGKQVRGMGGAGVLAAAGAVTQEETLERPADLEAHGAA